MTGKMTREEQARAIGGPVLARKIRGRRTRHVNADIDVSRRRDAIEALLAHVYAAPAAARRKMEKYMTKNGVEACVKSAVVNPLIFGGDWYGDKDPTQPSRPDEKRLLDGLHKLTGALAEAAVAATAAWPAGLRRQTLPSSTATRQDHDKS